MVYRYIFSEKNETINSVYKIRVMFVYFLTVSGGVEYRKLVKMNIRTRNNGGVTLDTGCIQL